MINFEECLKALFSLGGFMKTEKLKSIAKTYGTPLYLYDVSIIENQIKEYLDNFKSTDYETEVIYASKAFSIKEMIKIVKDNGVALDCVSLGELYTAKQVSFDMNKIYYHGNNKLAEELEMVINEDVGNIVVDNLMELEDIDLLTNKLKKYANIHIRLNVGVEAHTHKYIVTSHIDSKFGVIYGSDDYQKIIQIINNNKRINLLGFHCHIGSQILDMSAFSKALEKMIDYCEGFNYPLVLNVGGGFGVKYTKDDNPIPASLISKQLIETTNKILKQRKVRIKKLCIEPGRSIVAEAGVTLYTVGNIKQTPNKLYYFIDGGMTDNIRPALYQAKYECDIIGKENEPKDNIVTIAGKCCESGDIIIENAMMPKADKGDLLVVYTTGAYGYSMSSNYNKVLTPAVVFIKDGVATEVVRRQSYQELLIREK